MTKVLILSDSHGLTEEVTAIKDYHEIDYMIHCGDSELAFDASEMENFYKVAGNCDMDERYPMEQNLSIDGLQFFVTHGHLFNVKANLLQLGYRAKEENAQIICFGHTHIAGYEKVNEQLFINPGSIRESRGRSENTYAIIEWTETDYLQVNFYTPQGKLVDDLSGTVAF